MRTSVGYIGADAFLRPAGGGKGGRGGRGGSSGGGRGKRRG
jgi:23S rRNA pseudouridine2605 synthase